MVSIVIKIILTILTFFEINLIHCQFPPGFIYGPPGNPANGKGNGVKSSKFQSSSYSSKSWGNPQAQMNFVPQPPPNPWMFQPPPQNNGQGQGQMDENASGSENIVNIEGQGGPPYPSGAQQDQPSKTTSYKSSKSSYNSNTDVNMKNKPKRKGFEELKKTSVNNGIISSNSGNVYDREPFDDEDDPVSMTASKSAKSSKASYSVKSTTSSKQGGNNMNGVSKNIGKNGNINIGVSMVNPKGKKVQKSKAKSSRVNKPRRQQDYDEDTDYDESNEEVYESEYEEQSVQTKQRNNEGGDGNPVGIIMDEYSKTSINSNSNQGKGNGNKMNSGQQQQNEKPQSSQNFFKSISKLDKFKADVERIIQKNTTHMVMGPDGKMVIEEKTSQTSTRTEPAPVPPSPSPSPTAAPAPAPELTTVATSSVTNNPTTTTSTLNDNTKNTPTKANEIVTPASETVGDKNPSSTPLPEPGSGAKTEPPLGLDTKVDNPVPGGNTTAEAGASNSTLTPLTKNPNGLNPERSIRRFNKKRNFLRNIPA